MPYPDFGSSLYVKEEYSFHDNIMDICRKIEDEADRVKMNAICDHYQLDLSEMLEWIEHKRKPVKTNADKIRNMTDEKIASLICNIKITGCPDGMYNTSWCDDMSCAECWLDWLKQEATDDQRH